MRGFTKSKKKNMLKISAVYLIGKAEIPIHYTSWSQVEQALLPGDRTASQNLGWDMGGDRVLIFCRRDFDTLSRSVPEKTWTTTGQKSKKKLKKKISSYDYHHQTKVKV